MWRQAASPLQESEGDPLAGGAEGAGDPAIRRADESPSGRIPPGADPTAGTPPAGARPAGAAPLVDLTTP
eukprot:306035-Pyramimonas_sp.AAC.1